MLLLHAVHHPAGACEGEERARVEEVGSTGAKRETAPGDSSGAGDVERWHSAAGCHHQGLVHMIDLEELTSFQGGFSNVVLRGKSLPSPHPAKPGCSGMEEAGFSFYSQL